MMSSEGIIKYSEQRLPQCTGSTYNTHRDVLDSWVGYLSESGADIDEVGIEDVKGWLVFLRDERGYAHSHIALKLQVLKTVYNWVDEHELGDNPLRHLKKKHHYSWLEPAPDKVKESAEGISYVSKEDYRALVEAADGKREEVVIRSLAELGLRAQELNWLQVESFELEEQKVTIRTAKREDLTFLPGFFDIRYKLLIEDWLSSEREAWLSGMDEGSPYLVPGHEIPAIRTGETTDIVRDAAVRAGIQSYRVDAAGNDWADVTPHSLRHSFAVWRAKAGMPLGQLSKLLRHADISTTHDNYLRFAHDDLQDAYDEYRP
ncbi:hypothetical protein DJ71_17750 [Halorubrum sp. E3]|nr:hypothetical protein DJ71_17750 [Halorubrum sp. E3]